MTVAEPPPLPPTELRARTGGFVRVRTTDLAGRRVVEIDARGTEQAGALVESDGQSMAAGFRAARDQRLPILLRIASSGANAAEGVAALAGWAAAAKELTACSGVVPSIAIASGPAVSGPALLLGLADQVIMTPEAYVFMSGPMMVEEFTGVPISKAELGGTSVHDRTTGLASFTAADEDEAEVLAADLLSLFPDHTDAHCPTQQCLDPVDRSTPEAYDVLPPSTNGSYDVRQIIARLKAGRTVWYAPDQDYGPKHSVFAPFFGVPAASITATSAAAHAFPGEFNSDMYPARLDLHARVRHVWSFEPQSWWLPYEFELVGCLQHLSEWRRSPLHTCRADGGEVHGLRPRQRSSLDLGRMRSREAVQPAYRC